MESAFLAGSSSWDLNKDGVVTCDEWKGYIHSLFTEADVNRDGSLSREEFATFSKSDRMFDAADFAYWDANKDGRLTLAEMQAKPNPAFVLADRDKDCRLDASELVAARNITVVPIAKPPDTKSGSPGR